MEKRLATKKNIPIYAYTNPHLHSFCLCLYVKAGLLYETEKTNGLTHLWEHMIFRSVNAQMDHTLYRRLDKLGLSFEGYTYRELVQFKLTGAVRHFDEAAAVFLKIFEPLRITSADLQVEKKRIKAEIREDDDKSTLDYATGRIIWAGTPLENTIAGAPKILDTLGVRTLKEAHRTFLSANNLFVYVTGCVGEPSLRRLAESLDAVPLAVTAAVRDNRAPVPEAFFHRDGRVALKHSQYTCIRFSFDLRTDRYTQAELDVLYSLLFDGDSCRLLKELSDDTGYIYSYDARLEKYGNIGCLSFLYEVQLCHLPDSADRVIRILSELKHGGVALDCAKAPDTDNAGFLLDADEDLNWTMAYERHILNGGFRSIEERKREYAAVTAERIAEIAREIFRPDNLVVTLKGDRNKIRTEEIRNICLRLNA